MPNDLQDVDLSRHSLNICYIDNLAFFKDLNSNLFLCESVSTQFDLAECSLTYRLPQDVVPDGLVTLRWLLLRRRCCFVDVVRHFISN